MNALVYHAKTAVSVLMKSDPTPVCALMVIMASTVKIVSLLEVHENGFIDNLFRVYNMNRTMRTFVTTEITRPLN